MAEGITAIPGYMNFCICSMDVHSHETPEHCPPAGIGFCDALKLLQMADRKGLIADSLLELEDGAGFEWQHSQYTAACDVSCDRLDRKTHYRVTTWPSDMSDPHEGDVCSSLDANVATLQRDCSPENTCCASGDGSAAGHRVFCHEVVEAEVSSTLMRGRLLFRCLSDVDEVFGRKSRYSDESWPQFVGAWEPLLGPNVGAESWQRRTENVGTSSGTDAINMLQAQMQDRKGVALESQRLISVGTQPAKGHARHKRDIQTETTLRSMLCLWDGVCNFEKRLTGDHLVLASKQPLDDGHAQAGCFFCFDPGGQGRPKASLKLSAASRTNS